ncbi:SprT-like family protein [Nostoc sp. T09]|uniref:SprT-like domain-containing protein n=1 Tax=Nostoc sp. T09 TaxID=1932621 RepID=UPI000B64C9ED|nr:SprT-like domain-containing protein [Nostoc sp. T09]OUL28139.1 SprT-like family protein [Nostoc sp. T09]
MIKIRGILKTAQTVQDDLRNGLSTQKVAEFKQFIQSSVETIERLCAEAKTTPHHLPRRSREAYYFLKGIDLGNLPIASSQATQTQVASISIKNIKAQQNTILEKIFNLASASNQNSAEIQQLAQTLTRTVTIIEKICFNQQATPASLTRSSRQIYSWMKFLTDEQNLQLHLTSTYRVRQIAQEILNKHQQTSVKLTIELSNIAGLYKGKKSSTFAHISISEGFINASDEVLQALVKSVLCGKSQDSTRLIRSFASSEEYSTVVLMLDLIAEVISENPQGKFYNLDDLFNKLNHEYFAGHLVKPRLAWSKITTYRKFAHYEPARDRVVMSLTLDNANIPEFVTEFVLFHELLHKYHGTKWVNGRRMVHTPEFRSDENKFQLYAEAQRWLQMLASGES